MKFYIKKNAEFIWLFARFALSLPPKNNIRGAEAFAEAEKIPIEPDAGNAVGGMQYENKY